MDDDGNSIFVFDISEFLEINLGTQIRGEIVILIFSDDVRPSDTA